MSMVPRGGHGAGGNGSKDDHLPPAPSPVGSRALAQAYKRGLPTPSPLRRMEDPCADHIMPSRNDKGKKEKHALMLPPAVPPSRTRRKTQPQVLDEDTFVDAMGEIIERDFFPGLPRLHRQIKWLEALEARRLRSLTEVRRVVQSEMRRDTFAADGGDGGLEGGDSSSFSSAASTPVTRNDQRYNTPRSDTSVLASNSGESSPSPLPLSLDQFLAQFQSEDDAAFDVLAERMREAHRRKYWWIYSHPELEAGKEKLYLLPSGEMMTEEQHRKHVAAANAKPRLGDDRPNAPETWPSRPQNNFIFYPGSLEENAKVHLRGANAATQPQLLLLKQDGREGTRMLTAGAGVAGNNSRVGHEGKAPKILVHSNTRFSASKPLEWKGGRTGGPAGRASPLERLASELSTLSSETSFSTSTQGAQARATEGFVPMTPLLVPGVGGDVPIMTWGEIESTPLRVSEPFDYGGGGGEGGGGREGERKRFEIQGPTFREKVAGELEAKARTRGGKMREGRREGGGGMGNGADSVYASSSGGRRGGMSRSSFLTSSSSSSSSRSTSSSSSSKKRGLGSLTPAAQILAAKLAGGGSGGGGGGGGGVFGGGASSQLRASYSGSVGTIDGRGSSRRVAGSSILTPKPSPLRALPKRSNEEGGLDGGARQGGGGGSGSSGQGRGGGGEGGGGGGGGGGDMGGTSAGAVDGKSYGRSKVTENLLNF